MNPFEMGMAGAKVFASKSMRKNLVTTLTEKNVPISEYKNIAHDRRLQLGVAFVPSKQVVNTHGHIGIFFPNKLLALRGAVVQPELIAQGFSGEIWVTVNVTAPCYVEDGTLLGEILFIKEEGSTEFMTKRLPTNAEFQDGKFPQIA